MKRNMHIVDRLLRVVVVAPLAVWLAVAVGAGTVPGILALVFAGIMVVTGVSGICPLYTLVAQLTRGRGVARPGTGQ
jgi:Inner membrane protein YgaP-like, transmembrane domain